MKIPTMLTEALLAQASLDLGLSVKRDIEVIRYRVEHEGLSFLTISLPALSDALERGLESGLLTIPQGFSRFGRLPHLFGGFFRRVFSRDGKLLDEPNVECIYYIRQICRFWKKLKIGCTPEREAAAERQFIKVEEELLSVTQDMQRMDKVLDEVSRTLWFRVFPELDHSEFICRHGPGATAERLLSNERWRISKWYDRWEYTFPADYHAYPNSGWAWDSGEGSVGDQKLEYLGIRDEPGVRVVFVPKTQTAPRVIAIEPSSMQYVQQGVMRWLVPHLESHWLTQSVRFSDQTVNQSLARSSSKDRSLATLDLKEASDRVHSALVRRIFRGTGILPFLEDARSLHANLPSGRNVVLNKYASMGSALCFPVEAMVFYTLILAAIFTQRKERPSAQRIASLSRNISVYGDDIIIPIEYTDVVVQYLESYGLLVNKHKSFSKSHFRESCGGDFYKGISVKPIYAREVPTDPARRWEPEVVMSWCATHDQFYSNGQWHVASVIANLLRRATRRSIPRSRFDVPGVGLKSFLFDTNLRYSKASGSWQQKRLLYVPSKRKDTIDGDGIACLNRKFRSGQASQPLEALDLSFRRFKYPSGVCYTGLRDSRWDKGRSCELPSSISFVHRPLYESRADARIIRELVRRAGSSDSQHDLTSATDSQEIDFTTSTKRGCFKSKSRWVTIVS